MSEYTEQAQEAIEQIAEQYDENAADVSAKYGELLEEEESKGVDNPDERALRRLGIEYKGGQMSRTEKLQGYVLGASDPINTSRGDIERAKGFIEKHGVSEAIDRNMVTSVKDEHAAGLATVEVTVDGTETTLAIIDTNGNSPTSGEILPAEDWIRYIHGAVWRSPSDGPYLFTGVLNADDRSEKPTVPEAGVPMEFEAGWGGEEDGEVQLRFRDPDPFEPMESFGGPGVIELLEEGGVLVSLQEANHENFDRNDLCITKGSVTYMELAPDEGQNRRLTLVDPMDFTNDLRRTVWLADHVDIDFAEESDVYVVGQVSKSNNEYPDNINARGVFVHPDYKVDRSNIDSMSGEGSVEDAPADKVDDAAAELAEDVEENPERHDVDGVEDDTEAMTPAEAGEALADPEEVDIESDEDAEFQTGNEVDEPDSEYPPVVADANYTELQKVASGVEDVPGSGISEDEMRDQLAEAVGVEELGRKLIEDADDADGDGQPDQQPGDEPDPNEPQEDDDEKASEPDDEDDEWEW